MTHFLGSLAPISSLMRTMSYIISIGVCSNGARFFASLRMTPVGLEWQHWLGSLLLESSGVRCVIEPLQGRSKVSLMPTAPGAEITRSQRSAIAIADVARLMLWAVLSLAAVLPFLAVE